MFKLIELADGSEWACNRERQGVFSRRADGSWQQHTGTGQTPRFRDARHLSRWVHERFRDNMGERQPRMVGSRGWT